MRAYQADYTVAMLCRVLEVSPSGYYAWRKRPPSARRQADTLLGDRIEAFHRQSRCTYGRPKIQADLKDEGIAVSGKRVARLMRECGICGVFRRKGTITTIRNRDARPAPDLVDRNFRADPISFGSPTSPTFQHGLGSCTSPSFWMSSAAASWDGPWLIICALSSSLRHSTWRSSGAGRAASSTIPTKVRSTRRSRLVNGAVRLASGLRWVPSATATITRCARASTLHSNVSCSPFIVSRPSVKPRR